MKIDRKGGRVVIRRTAGRPDAFEGAYYTFLVLTALCSFGTFALAHAWAAVMMTTMFAAIGAMSLGLVVMSNRGAAGGRLQHIRSTLEVASDGVDKGYRDAPREPMLIVDGKSRFPKRSIREVVMGHFVNRTGGSGGEHHFWPVYIVLQDRVLEVGVYRSEANALRARRLLSELFEVPKREMETGVFGTGVGAGCLLGTVTVTLQLAAIFGGVAAHGDGFAPAPALMALALWAITRGATWGARGRVREGVDEQVAQTFDLGPKVRVEAEGDEVAEALAEEKGAKDELEAG